MRKLIIAFFFIMFFFSAFFSLHSLTNAEINAPFEVSPVFDDNMIFQQNEPIKIWGTSKCNGEVITAVLGDSIGSDTVKNGEWEITLSERSYSSEPLVLEICGGGAYYTFENIKIGDVWWIIGQSNVEYTVSASSFSDTFLSSLSGNENAVIYQIPNGDINSSRWRPFNNYSCYSASALGCFFTKNICDSIDNAIPIAIVPMGYSGHDIAAFMPPSLSNTSLSPTQKSRIYNLVLSYVEKMPIRGLIWYQGESDAAQYSLYNSKLESFITYMRTVKNQLNHDFPVYIIELPPCFYKEDDPDRQYVDFGTVRAESGALTYSMNNVFICPTSDLWSDRDFSNSLHPDNKSDIAGRLSMMVLSKEYGFGGEENYFGPTVSDFSISDNHTQIDIIFNNVGKSLTAKELKGFSVIGSDWNVIPDVKIAITSKNTISITSDEEICVVRYNSVTNNVFGEDIFLSNSNHIPAAAFSITLSPPSGSANFFSITNISILSFLIILILILKLLSKNKSTL